jgi:hypothetical protein
MKKTLIVLLTATTMTANAETVTLNAIPNPVHCKAGFVCNISAEHSISLQNTSTETRTYTVTYMICADNGECHKNAYNVPVAPADTWNHKHIMNLFTKFNRAKYHEVSYVTNVSSPWINKQYQLNGKIDVR